MAVNRCICRDLPFADLKRVAEAGGLSFEQLRERTGCCTGCGMCEPYVRLMLRTGRTDLPVLSGEEIIRLGVWPRGDRTDLSDLG